MIPASASQTWMSVLRTGLSRGRSHAADTGGSASDEPLDLRPSARPTGRGLALRARSRIAPGPLRPVGLRRAPPGIARGMLTGALLGIGVLTAFTLPFLREGSVAATTSARSTVTANP